METVNALFEELLSEYWEIAYKEGFRQESSGDEAQQVLNKLRHIFAERQQNTKRIEWLRKAMHEAEYCTIRSPGGALFIAINGIRFIGQFSDLIEIIDGAMEKNIVTSTLG